MDAFPRRRFITAAGGFTAAAVFSPQALAAGLTSAKKAPLLHGGSFPDGIMSGDPTPNGITLLTRVAGVGGSGAVELEIARDAHFRHVVARRLVKTSSKLNHSVKARIGKLAPHERYYYRFSTKTKNSPVGRFQTALPAGSKQAVTFAFFSCQDYAHGFYNAHALMATEDLDFVVCLGDYIYAETYYGKENGLSVREDTIGRSNSDNPDIIREAVTLADYRDKYALVRSDKNLQKVHALFPMVTTWDDHEVQDNYAGKPSDGGLPPGKHFSLARKRAGYRAFFEAMPLYDQGSPGDRIYRSLSFGRAVELIMLDERQYRDNQPCNDAVAPPCTELPNKRAFLGAKQMSFFKGRLKKSRAAWKVVGNELMMMPAKVGPDTYYGYDPWQGYPTEREEVCKYVVDHGIKDVIYVTGDIHTFITGDVRSDGGKGNPAGLEFVGGSISAPGLGETDIDLGGGNKLKGNDKNPNTPPAVINALKSFNPWVDQADFDHHGYGVVRATTKSFDCRLRRMTTIKKKTHSHLPDFHYVVERGQTSILGKSS